jgi:hypothetical protein
LLASPLLSSLYLIWFVKLQGNIIAGAAMAYFAILGNLTLQYWGIPFAILSYFIMQ